MTLTLGMVTTAARDKHPAFDQSRTPNVVLASALSSYQNRLIGKGVAREKNYARQTVTINVKAVDEAGEDELSIEQAVTLPDYVAIVGGNMTALDPSIEEPVMPLPFVGVGDRFTRQLAVYVVDRAIYLTPRADWTVISSIEVWYTPIALPFATLTDEFTVPDAAADVLEAYAASVCASRAAAAGETVDAVEWAAKFNDAEAAYLATIRLSRRTRMKVRREGAF